MTLFITAFLLGLIFNAAPGPVFVETIKQGAKGGFHAALQTQLGSLVGDASWAILGLTGIGLLIQIAVVRIPLGLAGAGYLLYLAWDSWRTACSEDTIGSRTELQVRPAFRRGMSLSLTNPQNLAFWAAIGSTLGGLGIAEPQTTDYMTFMAGFMASSLIWCFVCAAAVASILRQVSNQWTKLTYRLCSVSLLVLALTSLNDLMSPVHAHDPLSDMATPSHPQKGT
ncbi:LysE family translocator [Limnohabitans parvus]|uniref:Chemotaxis protein n=1 Tax=Limnohabitans parvus II-B4 TaxID=1293052 RepID=A0A315EHY5_9BURK|nr:LysE family transporter [Limnohabitans parvus]PUE55662.1 chemotaxis protein [Limnohabitans parvus II-B4]